MLQFCKSTTKYKIREIQSLKQRVTMCQNNFKNYSNKFNKTQSNAEACNLSQIQKQHLNAIQFFRKSNKSKSLPKLFVSFGQDMGQSEEKHKKSQIKQIKHNNFINNGYKNGKNKLIYYDYEDHTSKSNKKHSKHKKCSYHLSKQKFINKNQQISSQQEADLPSLKALREDFKKLAGIQIKNSKQNNKEHRKSGQNNFTKGSIKMIQKSLQKGKHKYGQKSKNIYLHKN